MAAARLVIIGAGTHCRELHLPALAHYQKNNPGQITLVGIADRDRGRAEQVAANFSIARVYGDFDEMLRREAPDACLAFTPVVLNAVVATKLMHLGIPLLMEKPLAPSLGEARELVQLAAQTGAQVMVSLNRRFAPSLHDALAWVAGRQIVYLRGAMLRHNRREEAFMRETAVHLIDVIRMIAGEVVAYRVRGGAEAGVRWFHLDFDFADGALGHVDILPVAGANAEVVELFGLGFRVEVRFGERDAGWSAWEDGVRVQDVSIDPAMPAFVANGTSRETERFVTALLSGRHFHPTPAEMLPSMEICHAVDRGV